MEANKYDDDVDFSLMRLGNISIERKKYWGEIQKSTF